MTERGKHGFVESRLQSKIAHRNGDVVDHAQVGASDLTSL